MRFDQLAVALVLEVKYTDYVEVCTIRHLLAYGRDTFACGVWSAIWTP